MAWVITRSVSGLRRPERASKSARWTASTTCTPASDRATFPNQLFIDPGRVHQLRRVRARVPVGGDLRGRAGARGVPRRHRAERQDHCARRKATSGARRKEDKPKPTPDQVAEQQGQVGLRGLRPVGPCAVPRRRRRPSRSIGPAALVRSRRAAAPRPGGPASTCHPTRCARRAPLRRAAIGCVRRVVDGVQHQAPAGEQRRRSR